LTQRALNLVPKTADLKLPGTDDTIEFTTTANIIITIIDIIIIIIIMTVIIRANSCYSPPSRSTSAFCYYQFGECLGSIHVTSHVGSL
jgi:hypothetical protein